MCTLEVKMMINLYYENMVVASKTHRTKKTVAKDFQGACI